MHGGTMVFENLKGPLLRAWFALILGTCRRLTGMLEGQSFVDQWEGSCAAGPAYWPKARRDCDEAPVRGALTTQTVGRMLKRWRGYVLEVNIRARAGTVDERAFW